MSEIKKVDHIVCICLAVGNTFEVIAKHSDNTTHTVGVYNTQRKANIEAANWKKKYRLEEKEVEHEEVPLVAQRVLTNKRVQH